MADIRIIPASGVINVTGSANFQGTGGSSVLYVSGSGNVGIGATAPLRKLHVVGNFAVNAGTGQYYGVNITGGEGTNPNILIGDWHNASANLTWDSTNRLLRIDAQYSTNGAPIVFSGNDAAIEYARFTATGNVGIGTTAPASGIKLDVSGSVSVAGAEGLRLGYVGDHGAYDNVKITYSGYNGGSPEVIFTPRTTPGSGQLTTFFRFKNSNGTAANNNLASVSIDNDLTVSGTITGNITGTAASETLQTVTTRGNSTSTAISTNGGKLVLRDDSIENHVTNANAAVVFNYYGYGTGTTQFRDTIFYNGKNGHVMTVDGSTSYVGIGVSAPTQKLDVRGIITSYAAFDNFSRMDNGSFQATGNHGGTFMLDLDNSGSADLVNVKKSGTSRFYIKNDGNVGIGTTSPAQKLDVNGAGIVRGGLVVKYGSNSGEVDTAYAPLLVNGPSTNTITYDEETTTATLVLRGNADNVNLQMGTGGSLIGPYGGWIQASYDNPGISGSEPLLLNPIGGNVGIGTTAPSARLHVSSSGIAQRLESNVSYTQLDFYNTSNGSTNSRNWAIGANLYNWGDFNIMASATSASAPNSSYTYFTINRSGNVGIGTTNPTTKLYVDAGESTFNRGNSDGAIARFRGKNAEKAVIGTVDSWFSSNVGIGTTSPTQKLSVAGNTDLGNSTGSTLSSTYTTKISGYAMRYDASNRYGNYGVLILNSDSGWTASARKFMLTSGLSTNKFAIIRSVDADTDPAFGDGGVISSGTADFVIDNSGNVGIGATSPGAKLTVLGNVRINGNIDYSAQVGITQPASGNSLNITNQADADLTFFITPSGATNKYALIQPSVSGQSLILNNQAGNVGIGTTSPSQKLHVVGDAALQTGELRLTQGYGITWNNGDNYIRGTSGYHLQFTTYDGASAQVEVMRLTGGTAASGGARVGIGTASPNRTLTVNGVLGVASGTTNVPELVLSADANGTYISSTYKGTSSYQPLVFETNGSEKVRITTGGNVGIGTTAPSARLDVYQSGSTALNIAGSQGQLFSVTDSLTGTLMSVNDISGLPILEVFDNDKVVMGAYNQNTLVVTGSNVGIGTDNPSGKLHIHTGGTSGFTVSHDATYYQGILNEYVSTYVTRTKFGRWNTSSNLELYYDIAGTEEARITRNYSSAVLKFNRGAGTDMIIDGSGNVGIGLTNPTVKLQVLGTISGSLIHSSGDVVAYQSSDQRLKDNLTPIADPIYKLQQIGGYEFDWNSNQDVYQGHDIGVVAQEIEKVLPEIVATRGNGYKAVKYEKIVALLIEGMKEQQKQIDELKAKLDGLTK